MTITILLIGVAFILGIIFAPVMWTMINKINKKNP